MSKRLNSICLFLLLSLLILAIAPSTQAATATVSFSDLNLVGGQVLIYSYNGTFMGQYNTTDANVVIPDNAIITFKPAPTDYFKNPSKYPDFIFSLVGPGGALFLALFAVGAIWYVFFKR